jgi:hypothetical protein
MTLLSPLALLFALAAAVPLLLHLYQRRRKLVVLFSTNRFFTRSIVRSQRRLRLRRLLLLVLRMSACILFAFALARPILGLAGLAGRSAGARDLVVLLDDSLSMQACLSAAPNPEAGTPTPDSRHPTPLALARAAALEVLSALTSGDRAAVVTFSGRILGRDTRAGMQLTSDIPRLVEQLQQVKAIPAAGDALAGLKQAADLLKDGGSGRARSLLILTDMQAGDWGQTDWPQPEAPVRTVLARLGSPARDNLLVDQVMLSQGTAVAGQPNLIRVRLVSHRPQAALTQLVLRMDDKEVSRRQVDLPGGSPLVERIPLVFERPGGHSVVASLETQDALADDDTFYATVQVNPRLPVLLVSGDIETAGQKPAAFYLQAALQAVSEDPALDSIPVQTIVPADLSSRQLDTCRAVILSNVANLPTAQVDALEQFVRAGGGLAILLGDRCEAGFYNDVLGAPSRPLGGLLPAEIRSRLGAEGAGEPMHLVQAEMDHPLFARFQGALRGALAGINIYQAYGLSPRDGWVLASIDGPLPLIVERRYGQGRVILIGTVPKPSWTDWPVRRAFIPLVSSLVSHLAGGTSLVADQAVCRDLLLGATVRSGDQPPKVRRPDGSLVTAQVKLTGGRPTAYVSADLADQVGLYRVEPATGSVGDEIIAVNASRRESSCDVLDLDQAVQLAGRWQPTVVDLSSPGEGPGGVAVSRLTSALRTSPPSTGIWNALLWAVLAIVAVEPLIANRNPQAKDASEIAGGFEDRKTVVSRND